MYGSPREFLWVLDSVLFHTTFFIYFFLFVCFCFCLFFFLFILFILFFFFYAIVYFFLSPYSVHICWSIFSDSVSESHLNFFMLLEKEFPVIH